MEDEIKIKQLSKMLNFSSAAYGIQSYHPSTLNTPGHSLLIVTCLNEQATHTQQATHTHTQCHGGSESQHITQQWQHPTHLAIVEK